ncbi:unnamed protein product [Penicillium roqueforti FM164]|uniref:Genomic scaffold, ProqFM164S02 n=1 Tax=Penicillium roqueforti (strain FM164) TaxID=1365484 RepID=W6Q730_PENRF|nr:unnamed protein product [Penicillium roqueforti FM164]
MSWRPAVSTPASSAAPEPEQRRKRRMESTILVLRTI